MLTIHVGLHKTGSTSIQTVLSLEQGHIRRRQVYLRWHDLFVTDGEVRTCNVAKIVALSKRGWHVVVSSEGALGAMADAYPRAANVAAQLAVLFSEIPLQVVLYLRPHHQWAESALRQHLKEGGDSEPDGFARNLLASRGFHHSALVDDLSAVLPSGGLIVRPFDSQTDVVQDFFAHCSLGTVPPAFCGLRANSSGMTDADASPFSPAMQESLVHHFRADWGLLLDGLDPAVSGARSELLQLLGDESPIGHVAKPVGSLRVSLAEQSALENRHAGPELKVRLTTEKLVWTMRHGPRQLLLRYLVARDAGERRSPSAGTAAAGSRRSRSSAVAAPMSRAARR